MSNAGTQPKTPSMIFVTRMSEVASGKRGPDLAAKSRSVVHRLAVVAVGVDRPDRSVARRDGLDDRHEVLDAPLQEVGRATEHAPAREVEAELETGELQVVPASDRGDVVRAHGSDWK